MRVLVIGGTRFVGRHIVQALQERGHQVALFNRGKSAPGAFSLLEQIHGDRLRDLDRLDGRTWDAVVDVCGYTPDAVEIAARYFAGRTDRYAFVSTVSVYDFERGAAGTAKVDEDWPLAKLPAGADRTRVTPETYGALKVLCEAIVRSTFRQRATIVRPGVVAGPDDPTDRFTYWPVRVDAGGTVLAPESASLAIRYVDARDLANFTVHLLEREDAGTYNAVTPPGAVTFGTLLEACRRGSGSGAQLQWVDGAFLTGQGVQPWSDLPLWIPSQSEAEAHLRVSSARGMVAGLRCRPVLDTVRDTLAWAREAGKRWGALTAGIGPDREAELLRKYRERLTAAVE